jgi:hypothetical protein
MRIPASAVTAFCVSMLVVLGAADPVAAEPTEAQRSAIKANCRADFMSNCAGVQPGGPEAMQCLEKNLAKLSPSCQQAVNAVAAPAAPSTAPAATKSESAPAQPAATEAPSAGDKSETKSAEPAAASPPKAAPETSAKPAAPAAAPAEIPPIIGFIPPREKLMILSNCRQDLAAHCAGVQPGGNRELRCLLSNQSALTPGCRGALATLAQ